MPVILATHTTEEECLNCDWSSSPAASRVSFTSCWPSELCAEESLDCGWDLAGEDGCCAAARPAQAQKVSRNVAVRKSSRKGGLRPAVRRFFWVRASLTGHHPLAPAAWRAAKQFG